MSDEVSSIRESDRRQLQRLVDASPRTRVVTVRGDAGIGKSTLLAGLAAAAVKTGWQVLRATGSTSETMLSLAGLHQLLRPLLGSVDTLPAPQRAAVSAAFGLAEAARPTDPLLLYLGCLTLLSQHSERVPLLLVVDDAQW